MEILGSSLPFVKEDRKRDSGQNVRRLFVITIRQLLFCSCILLNLYLVV